jgi:hypothetical protein
MSTIERASADPAREPTKAEPVRFEKIVLVDAHNPKLPLGTGDLLAEGDSLRFELTDKKGNVTTLPLPHVRDVHFTSDKWEGVSYVTIEFGDAPVNIVRVRQAGQVLHPQAATKALADRLRREVAITPLSAQQQAEIEQAARASERRQGTRHMLWGAIAAIVGSIVTLSTYASAGPGGTYFVWWGPMLFGILYFIWGVAEYTRRRPKL